MVEACLNHLESLEQACSRNNWREFHQHLVEKRPAALDKVINVLDMQIRSARGENSINLFENDTPYPTSIGIFHSYVTNTKIFDHFHQYLNLRRHQEGVSDKEDVNRLYWNTANNLLRSLRRIRNDQAPFLMPEKDKDEVLDFIEMFEHPPIDYI